MRPFIVARTALADAAESAARGQFVLTVVVQPRLTSSERAHCKTQWVTCASGERKKMDVSARHYLDVTTEQVTLAPVRE